MNVMKQRGVRVAAILLASQTAAWAQQQPAPSGFQAYTPPVVGGLPPNATRLNQPVYVAERAVPSTFASDGRTDAEFLDANGLGIDPKKPIPTIENMALFGPGELIAAVGEETITIGDLVPVSRLTPEIMASPQFETMLRKKLIEVVPRKAMAQRFINEKVSAKPLKERDQARMHMQKQTAKIFHQKWMPSQRERMNCQSDLELIEKLEKMGESLMSMQKEFTESMWAQEHLRESVKESPIVELSDMQDYYNDNIESFQRQAKARFQIISASFSKYPSKQVAYQNAVEMWNEVYYGGAPFDAVAKRRSTGVRASDGGVFDWTNQGSLKSTVIDKAVFENPVRGLSQILEDQDGYHFVEVLERKPATTQTFVEAQPEIRKLLTKKKSDKLRADFIKKVRDETPVWTKWPSDIPGALDLSMLR
jgi:hypothetical protein